MCNLHDIGGIKKCKINNNRPTVIEYLVECQLLFYNITLYMYLHS